MVDLRTIEQMRKSGITMTAPLRIIGGDTTVRLDSPADIVAYLADQDQYAANFFGVTKAQYREWLEHNGCARCGGFTKRNRRCRNYLSGFGQLAVKEWLKRDGGYCVVHGDEGSKEAQALGYGEDRSML